MEDHKPVNETDAGGVAEADAVNQAESAKAADAVKPAESPKPADAVKTAGSAKPAGAADTSRSADASQTAEATVDAETAQDAQAGATGSQSETSDKPGAAPTGEALSEIEQLLAERDDMKNRYMRTMADMDNLRRRLARDREEIRRTAAASVIEALLPALDNLQLGLDSAANHPEAAPIAKGFEFVAQQITQILEEHGLSAVRPNEGDAFNPNTHEATTHEPHDSVPDDHILRVQRVGYQLNERLLRAASVVVSSGPAEQPEPTDA